MNKTLKKKSIFDLYYIQLVVVLLIICFLFLSVIVLLKDINKGNSIVDSYDLIKSLYISAILGGVCFTYSQGEKSFKFQLCFGLTRKEIFYDSAKRISQVIIVTLFLSLFYVWVDNYFSGVATNVFKIFRDEGLLFLIEVLTLSCLIGFSLGLLKLNSKIAFLIICVFSIILMLFLGKINSSEIGNLIMFFIILLFILTNRILVEKVKVK